LARSRKGTRLFFALEFYRVHAGANGRNLAAPGRSFGFAGDGSGCNKEAAMYASIRRYQGQPGQTEETIRRVKQGLLPLLTAQPGFTSYAALDAGNDVAVSVSLYESRVAADAANRAAASWVKSNLADLVGPGEVIVGEVLVSANAEQRSVDVVRKGYEAFGRGDIPGLLALLDDQIVWTTPGPPEVPFAGTRRGPSAVAQFFQSLASVVDIVRFEPRQFIAQGDQVIVVGDDTAQVKATGASLDFRWTHVFTVRNDKIVAFEEYSEMSALVAELARAHAKL
jgi:ketosteroid isomerase-like protein